MATEALRAPECSFCGGLSLQQTHAGLFHPLKRDHGPFNFHRCLDCGSGLTLDPPAEAELARLYASFRNGLPGELRDMMEGDPQHELYRFQVRRIRRHAERTGLAIRRWMDVGAGAGELSRLLAREWPDAEGLAVDLHDRPTGLADAGRVSWKTADLNGDDFASAIGRIAPLVISSAVWEHVRHPGRFARNLLQLVEPGGILYLMTPDYGSLMRRLMGRRWPYFAPGEHLNIPTPAGARLCLGRQWRTLHGEGPELVILCGSIPLPYTLRYTLQRIHLGFIGRLFPPGLSLPLPTGVLEAVARIPVRPM